MELMLTRSASDFHFHYISTELSPQDRSDALTEARKLTTRWVATYCLGPHLLSQRPKAAIERAPRYLIPSFKLRRINKLFIDESRL